MTTQRNTKEFIVMIAFLTALSALSIDSILPAMGVISQEFGVGVDRRHFLISALMLGMSIGQLFYGPLADSYGRKPSLFLGLSIFLLGSVLALFSTSFTMIIIARFLQGLGVASSRVVTGAIIRDSYSGAAMAQIMSFSMSVFILIPIIAPALGQGILVLGSWRYIFVFMILIGILITIWFGLLQEETLKKEQKQELSLKKYFQAIKTVISNRQTIGFTMASGTVFGGFLGYLTVIQSVFDDIYHLGNNFALYFGFLSVVFGFAFILNAKMVMRFSMVNILKFAVWGVLVFSINFYAFFTFDPEISVNLLTALLVPIFFCVALIFGNLNALAMVPMGQIAGSASSVIGSISTFISVPVGVWVGSHFDNTLWSLSVGFLATAPLSLALVYWASYQANESDGQVIKEYKSDDVREN